MSHISEDSENGAKAPRNYRREWALCASKLLVRRGKAALQITRICSAMNSSRSNFYYHFLDKTDLYHEMADLWAGLYLGDLRSLGDERHDLSYGIFSYWKRNLQRSDEESIFLDTFPQVLSNNSEITQKVSSVHIKRKSKLLLFFSLHGYNASEATMRAEFISSTNARKYLKSALGVPKYSQVWVSLYYNAITGRSLDSTRSSDFVEELKKTEDSSKSSHWSRS